MNGFVKQLLGISILLFISNNISAQFAIKGVVMMDTMSAVKATVYLNNQSRITDSSGQFHFTGLASGKYQLHISMIGAEPFLQTIQIKNDKITELKIQLQPSTSSLDAVVISGTMKAVKKLESPIAVEVYTPQFFRKNPTPSIFEALQNVNGVRPQINCSVCNTGDIHINGLEGPYTMVTIDGMPIVSSLSSVYGLFGIPTEMIEQVEIVKGPASGLYGSEAIGGLINVITKKPEKSPLLTASLMSTNWKEHTLDLGLKAKMNKLQSLIGVSYFNYGTPIDKNGDQFTDVTLQNRISIFNKWQLQRKFNREASFAGRWFNENRWGGDVRWTKKFRGTDSIYGESIYTNRWELVGKYQLPFVEKMFFSFSATDHDQNSYYGQVPYMAKQKILFGQLLWDKPVKFHNLLFGISGRYNFYDDNSTATTDTLTLANMPDKYFIPSFFVQDEFKLSGAHTLLLGLRYDHHPVHKTIFTPRFAYKWSIDNRQALRLNAGTGFRVVNIFTEDHAALTGARVVEIREKLQPERSYNVNLNFTRHFGTPSKSFNIDASVWYSYFKNQIIADYDSHPNKIIYNNLKGYAVSNGATLNLEANFLQRLKALLGVTIQDIKKVDIENGKMTTQIPMLTEKWSGTWSLSYSMPLQGLTLDYTGNIYGPMRLPLISHLDPRKPYSPVWSLQNLQVKKWFSSTLEVFAGVKNMLNWTPTKNNPFLIPRTHDPFDKKVEYENNGAVKANAENPFALTFDPSYIYAPNQGRRYFAGVRIKVK